MTYPTSIGHSDRDSISLLGHDLSGELIGQVGFGELAFWLVAQRRPGAGEVRVFEAVLVALADHGLTPSAIAARLTLTGAPESVQGAVAAGLLGGGSRFLGVTEDCGRFLATTLATPPGLSMMPAQVGVQPRNVCTNRGSMTKAAYIPKLAPNIRNMPEAYSGSLNILRSTRGRSAVKERHRKSTMPNTERAA